MSLLSMLESSGTLKRPTIGRDSQQGVTQNPFVAISPSVPCSVQPANKDVVMLYAQRNTQVTTSIFFAQDIQAQVNDRFESINRGGQPSGTYLVRGYEQEVDRMVVWRMDAQKMPPPTKPSAVTFDVAAPSSIGIGEEFAFIVTAVDAVGNTVTDYAGVVQFFCFGDLLADLPASATLTSGTGSFLATLNTLGLQTIIAQDTVSFSIYGTSNAILVSETVSGNFAGSEFDFSGSELQFAGAE